VTRAELQLERNRALVIRHLDEFVNRRDLDAVIRNMAAGFVDHDGPSGERTGREGDRAMMAAMHARIPDLRVEVLVSVAEADLVAVRNRWTGTEAATGRAVEFHGFVLWRIADGQIAERWATVTPLQGAMSAGVAP
jgi:predicted ester cyclase